MCSYALINIFAVCPTWASAMKSWDPCRPEIDGDVKKNAVILVMFACRWLNDASVILELPNDFGG